MTQPEETNPQADTKANSREISQGLKTLLEFGPLVAFFAANYWGGIFVATMAIMITTPIALAITWLITRKLSIMPIVTLVLVAIFGGMTLYFQDETFIKIKVTIINLIFAGILLGGLLFKKPLLKYVFGEALNLHDTGWKKMTLNWGIFFLVLALINEMVWRNVTTDTWVNFKTFGILPLTFLFALSQTPLMQRYTIAEEEEQK